MKFSINHLSKLIAPCVAITIMAASNVAEASITISFSQQGSDVVAVASGSLRTAEFVTNDTSGQLGFADGISASSNGLVAFEPSDTTGGIVTGGGNLLNFSTGSGVTSLPTNFFVSPDSTSSFTGTAFGFADNSLFIEQGEFDNEFDSTLDVPQFVSIIEPNTVWTFQNQTLSGIGLGAFSTAGFSQVVYTDNLTGDTIVFAPEPSSMLMLALGAVGFTFRRRR